jgi:hypothetical protein
MEKKLTLLERYWKIKLNFETASKEAPPSPVKLWVYQELLYRIHLLDSLQLIVKAAPLSNDIKVLYPHYQVVDKMLENIRSERFLKAKQTEQQEQQKTASDSLNAVIEDYRKRYANYAPASPNQYQEDIRRTVSTVLPAWITYRNTITDIKVNMEEAS